MSLPELPPTDLKAAEYNGPSYEEALEKRKKYMHPSLMLYHPKEPVMMVDGKMQYVWDVNGRRYLDCIGGIVTISAGHCHPKVTKAAQDQCGKLNHTSCLYVNDQVVDFSEALVKKMPANSGLDTVFFVNSGSEANDLALHMARCFTGKFDVIGTRNGYHGMGAGSMGITAFPKWRAGIPQGFGVHHALCPVEYQGVFGNDAQKYADELEDLITHVAGKGQIACMFLESGYQGIGGCAKIAEGYPQKAIEIVHKHGGLWVADEVQTGFGRLGTHYWGFEKLGITPDIVTMAKGMGNGYPLAAVVTRREIAQAMAETFFFNTFGGNPLVCAVGKAILEAIDEDGLQQNCLERGAEFLAGFEVLKQKYPLFGDYRGAGLMLGVELVKDRTTKAPATAETAIVHDKCKEMGLLIGKGGPYGSCLRIKPPMCVSSADVQFALKVLDLAFAEASK